MTDDDSAESSEADEDAEAPAVELGDHGQVAGAPPARVASRLTWPVERSEIVAKEGATTIRTPDGPIELSEALEDVDVTYFARRQVFLEAVRDAIGEGPIPTEQD